MEKMDFVLPDFTRVIWVSQQAEKQWANRLAKINHIFSQLEVFSVSEGQRRCCIVCVSPVDLVKQAKVWLKYDLSFLPVDRIGVSRFTYSSTTVPLAQNNNFVYKMAVGKPKDLKKFIEAWTSSNDFQIGSLLGYPKCCTRFFNNHWTTQGHVDTTWAMAMQTGNKLVNDRIIAIDGPSHANILWRWVGVRAVPHLPCSFDCKNTITFAKAFWECANASQSQEYEWLNEILSWPVEWSALHGIAEIKTPILKIIARSDANPYKYTVKKIGQDYPPEGANGLVFPYRVNSLINSEIKLNDWYFMDNGFASASEMDSAQEPIVQVASNHLDERSGNILDLGCGNGGLLKKITKTNESIIPYGIDNSLEKVKHARILIPGHRDNFHVGNMFCEDLLSRLDKSFELVLLMPGRLLEVDEKYRHTLYNFLRKNAKNIMVYAYGDWLTRFEGLGRLATLAGFRLLCNSKDPVVSLAIIC